MTEPLTNEQARAILDEYGIPHMMQRNDRERSIYVVLAWPKNAMGEVMFEVMFVSSTHRNGLTRAELLDWINNAPGPK